MECASNVVALIPYVGVHATIQVVWDLPERHTGELNVQSM